MDQVTGLPVPGINGRDGNGSTPGRLYAAGFRLWVMCVPGSIQSFHEFLNWPGYCKAHNPIKDPLPVWCPALQSWIRFRFSSTVPAFLIAVLLLPAWSAFSICWSSCWSCPVTINQYYYYKKRKSSITEWKGSFV